MSLYRKKPVVIEARQFNPGEGSIDVAAWCGGKLGCEGYAPFMTIPTLEGDMRAAPGDFIIKGVQGEFYPCKPDIFAATYEPVPDGAS